MKFYTCTGLPGADVEYPKIIAPTPNVLSTSGGQIVIAWPNGGATGCTSVKIGDTEADTITVDSDTQVTATFGALSAGQYDLTCVSPAGTAVAHDSVTVQEAAGAPDDFTISCQPENYDSIKINISLSSNAIYYVVYRDGVPISPNLKSHYYIDASGPGTFTYFVRAYGETVFTDSNEVEITRDDTGFVDFSSMLTFIQKMLLNKQCKITESGVTYLVTYDDDDVNIICKQPLKTLLGNDVIVEENSLVPEQRLRSLVYSVGTINEADLTNLLTLITKDHFFLKKIEEKPKKSGVKQQVLYDADNKTVLIANRLKTFENNDLGDLSKSKAPMIREKSIL